MDMEKLMENDAFFNGVVLGLLLYQQKVVTAHKAREPLKIGEDLYYLESGRERLERAIDEICR